MAILKNLHKENLFDIITKDTDNNLLCFLGPKAKRRLENSFGDKEKIKVTLNNIIELQSIWKLILIDAIHFLRINDCRERAFLIDGDCEWKNENKTTMLTDGSSDVASLNAYGIEELFKYFEQFTEFESTLYGTDTYYRDHVQHPLYVWLIGLNILKEYGLVFRCITNTEIKIENSPYANPEWPTFHNEKVERGIITGTRVNDNDIALSIAELSAMWSIAALTHDLGYPLEKVERVNEQLEQMLNQFGNVSFIRSNFTFQTQHDHLVKALLEVISTSIVAEINDISHRDWFTHIRH